jgi:biotin---protein ligase
LANSIVALTVIKLEIFNCLRICIFSDATVRLGTDNGDEATIVGLDDYGFLLVRLQKDGSTVSVQPDGNSFDMMRNLILPKNS